LFASGKAAALRAPRGLRLINEEPEGTESLGDQTLKTHASLRTGVRWQAVGALQPQAPVHVLGRFCGREEKIRRPVHVLGRFVDGRRKYNVPSTFWGVFVDGRRKYNVPSTFWGVFVDETSRRTVKCRQKLTVIPAAGRGCARRRRCGRRWPGCWGRGRGSGRRRC